MASATMAVQRPRTEQTVLGCPLYLYHNADSIGVWTQDDVPLGMLLLERGGYSVGYSLDSTGRSLEACLEQLVRDGEVTRV